MSSFAEDVYIYNGHMELEVTIKRPVRVVWQQYIDIASWVTSHTIETLSGEPGALGSITRVSFKKAKELSMPSPHYHYCKIIKLEPKRQYVLKTYTEKEGAYGMQMLAFDDTRFIDLSDKTKLIFNLFAEVRSEAIANDPTSMNLDGSRDGMMGNLNNLKQMLESRP
jgi:hypothetical protein